MQSLIGVFEKSSDVTHKGPNKTETKKSTSTLQRQHYCQRGRNNDPARKVTEVTNPPQLFLEGVTFAGSRVKFDVFQFSSSHRNNNRYDINHAHVMNHAQSESNNIAQALTRDSRDMQPDNNGKSGKYSATKITETEVSLYSSQYLRIFYLTFPV